jgi:methionyl-tRNA formyltransferase
MYMATKEKTYRITSLWAVIEAMQKRLEGEGLDVDVVDAAVARGLEALLIHHYQRSGERVIRRSSLLDASAIAKA